MSRTGHGEYQRRAFATRALDFEFGPHLSRAKTQVLESVAAGDAGRIESKAVVLNAKPPRPSILFNVNFDDCRLRMFGNVRGRFLEQEKKVLAEIEWKLFRWIGPRAMHAIINSAQQRPRKILYAQHQILHGIKGRVD